VRTSGTLADRIETSPEFERLMEEFLDKELEYVLVDSMDEALLGLSEVKTLEGGKCTFLSIQSNNGFGKGNRRQIVDPKQPGVFGTVGSLLEMDPEVEDAFQRVLPQRAEAIVVSDLDRAFQMAHTYPENTFVTMGGEALTPRGLLASTATGSGKLGLLGIKRQKKLLETKVRNQQKKQVQQQREMASTQAEVERGRLACESNANVLNQLEKDIISLSHQKEQCQSEVQHKERASRVVSDEMAQLDAEEARLKDRIEDVSGQRSEAERRRTEANASLAETQHTLQQLRLESERMQEQLHLVASDQKVLEERRASLGRTLARVEEQRVGLESRLSTAVAVEQEARDRIGRLESELEELKSRLETLDQRETKASAALNQCREEYQKWKETFPAIEEELQALQDQKNEHQDKQGLLEVEQAKFETQLQNISQQCREQSQMSLDEVLSQLDSRDEIPPLEEVLEKYDRLKHKMDSFGPINMTALDEYQESEERHEFLVKQRQDIESSIEDTLKAIQRLNRRSREKFKEAFDAVNCHFQEVFQKLFGGGECGMRLLDEDDLLESGVDIYARPPGKKLQNVMLLSGGEKALTVLALLVGLFTYRPSRFCILDEVDAPLDDANVTRFNNLMREMSRHTQMILVTHNKLTMENTDSMFGVTMAQPGISQVVSVKF
jgi:chromosome segregation protein